ncbi:MAG: arginine--tRNA ligase [Flavobacteriaceae bacterium]
MIQQLLQEKITAFLAQEFDCEVQALEFQATRKDFEGDLTLVVFPLLRLVKMAPEALGESIGNYLQQEVAEVVAFNVVKGFLNLSLSDKIYIDALQQIATDTRYGHLTPHEDSPTLMVEYSSPNTNKPLHLGHIRNNLLGYSVAQILEAAGNNVHKTQIINDRGIHICKSMVAWQRFGAGETPSTSGMKGDFLVGKYYVRFDQEYKKEVAAAMADGLTEEAAKAQAPILLEAQEMLRQWEAQDPEIRSLWAQMNDWVYTGFNETYRQMGVDFDSYYYESDTYLLGKEIIEKGLSAGVFFRKPDGSVWIDLTDEGLDEKILLRSDGTAVYMTQDLGTAAQRVADIPSLNGMVYTVGNEQDYHFQVLFKVLKRLGYTWADRLFHLSYGMVDLPSGKMKSREGTVVDADDLMRQMSQTAKTLAEELGKLEGMESEQKETLYQNIGLGALKYYILKVDPKKRILFDPEASVDFNGNTGPFIQYTHARICSLLRKNQLEAYDLAGITALDPKEKEVIKQLMEYPELVQQAAKQHSPALIANYMYDVVRLFNSFYQNVSIMGTSSVELRQFRLILAQTVALNLKNAGGLLGIQMPEQM